MIKGLLMAGALIPAGLSAQTAEPVPNTIPPAVDRPYPGTINLDVDATNVAQGVFSVRETIPVAGPGPLTLLYPQWKPGNHAPSGQIKRLASLVVTANGRPLTWTRDPVDMFAFHLDVPAGVRQVEARFQYLSPLDGSEGDRVVAAPTLANLQWESVSLYPAGTYVRNLRVKASATYPAGWTAFTALRGVKTGARVDYPTVAYDVLVDSPVYAGLHTKQVALDKDVSLDLVADTPDLLAITPEQIAAHKALVTQADRLFGTRHYDHYDFLVALSEVQSADGLEHHRSSENTLEHDLLTEWKANFADRYVVAHEYVHSWNGKFRRGADLWTPDYRTPMRNSLLWVYEGQTQFWGDVLAARSGLWSAEEYRDQLAMVAAGYTQGTPGTAWRPLQDTVNDPIQTGHGNPSTWSDWTRAYDYYRNSELVWIEVDQTIRERTGGQKGLDDFARLFFGVEPGAWDHEKTYGFDDVVAALNTVAPYDWRSFLRSRLDGLNPATTLAGIEKGGYRLVYTDKPTDTMKAVLAKREVSSFSYSVGLSVKAKGSVVAVGWGSPAFKAGMKPGDELLAVGTLTYKADRLADAITAAKGTKLPVRLVVKSGEAVRTVDLDYHDGLRYPRLVRIGTGPAGLDRLISAK
jgi:predicted metalloprotease with PDZ domain